MQNIYNFTKKFSFYYTAKKQKTLKAPLKICHKLCKLCAFSAHFPDSQFPDNSEP